MVLVVKEVVISLTSSTDNWEVLNARYVLYTSWGCSSIILTQPGTVGRSRALERVDARARQGLGTRILV
jgi:hypothetical protein